MKKPSTQRSTLIVAIVAIVVLPAAAFALASVTGDSNQPALMPEPVIDTPIAECTPGEPATVRFAWQPAANATEQRLELSTAADGSPVETGGNGDEPLRGSASNLTVEGLQPGVAYAWSVEAMTPEGPQTSATGRFVPCGAPIVHEVSYDCEGAHALLHFKWSPALSESGFASEQRLELSASGDFAPGVTWTEEALPAGASSFEWPSAVANVEYHYRVAMASEAGGEAGPSGLVHVACDYLNPLPCDEILAPVNKSNQLGADCTPDGLVFLPEAVSVGEQMLTQEAADAFLQMLDAAAAEGHEMVVTSAYRSYDVQSATFDHWVDQRGVEEAERTSARPGHSEHQLGTTADVTTAALGFELTAAFADTPEGRWTLENAHRFGFVVSYPEGMEYLTGYVFEPWHLRYVGEETATAVREAGVTLHEFLLLRWY